MQNLYGFSLIKNGIKYDYSFVEALNSLSPIVKKTVVAVGKSDDETLNKVSSLPKVDVLETIWNTDLKQGLVLSDETNKALIHLKKQIPTNDLKNAWAIYLQADECLHEDDYEILLQDLEKAEAEGYDAIMFSYLHFWQTHHHVATAKRWYPHEVRAIKLDTKIESWGIFFRTSVFPSIKSKKFGLKLTHKCFLSIGTSFIDSTQKILSTLIVDTNFCE